MAYKLSPGVLWRRVGKEIVILLPNSEYFTLSGSGADAWEWLCQGLDEATVASRLVQRYQVSPKQAKKDVSALRAKFVKSGLLAASAAPGKGLKRLPKVPTQRLPYSKSHFKKYGLQAASSFAWATY